MNRIIEWFRDPGPSGLIMFIVGVLGIVVAIVLWVISHIRGKKAEKTDITKAEVQKTGDGSTTTIDQSRHVKSGLDGEEVAKIVDTVIARQPERPAPLDDLTAAHQQIGRLEAEKEALREQLTAAIQRAAAARDENLADAGPAREAIRQLEDSGDTAGLQRFLQERIKLVRRFKQRADDEEISLNRQIAAVAYLGGEIDTAESAIDEILQVLPGDFHALTGKGIISYLRGELDEAKALFERVFQLAAQRDDERSEAAAHGNLALVYQAHGELDKAEEMHREALEIQERLGLQPDMANEYGNLGLIYQTRGEFDKAEEMHHKALQINNRLGREGGMANQYGNLGSIYGTRGELDKAEEMFQKSLEIDERRGWQEGKATDYGNLGLIYQTRGELDKAEEMFRKALEINKRLGRQEGMARQYGSLGLVLRNR